MLAGKAIPQEKTLTELPNEHLDRAGLYLKVIVDSGMTEEQETLSLQLDNSKRNIRNKMRTSA